MLLELKYNGCLSTKLHGELIEANVYPIDKYFVGEENPTVILFSDIQKTTTTDEQEQTVTTYQKLTKEVIDEGLETEHTVDVWYDYTAEVTNPIDGEPVGLLAKVQAVVDAHDCTPLPVPKTEAEIQAENIAILFYEQQKLKGEI